MIYMGVEGNAVFFMIGKPEQKRKHGRGRHRWEDNMKMDLKET
jgi:hypothetical protein